MGKQRNFDNQKIVGKDETLLRRNTMQQIFGANIEVGQSDVRGVVRSLPLWLRVLPEQRGENRQK